MKSIIEPNRVYQIKSKTVHFSVDNAVRLLAKDLTFLSSNRWGAIREFRASDDSARRDRLAGAIHDSHGASRGIRHHGAFTSLVKTGGMCPVTESNVITNTFVIHSVSGELSQLAPGSLYEIQDS